MVLESFFGANAHSETHQYLWAGCECILEFKRKHTGRHVLANAAVASEPGVLYNNAASLHRAENLGCNLSLIWVQKGKVLYHY